MTTPDTGILLIANPFLKDPNFLRNVVLICDHNEEGTYGLTLSRKLTITMSDILPDLTDSDFPVYLGGPVQPDSLQFVHNYPDLINGGKKIKEGVFTGGNFESTIACLNAHELNRNKIKFFVGYSGWGPEQLDSEMKIDSWLTVPMTDRLLFNVEAENIWKESLTELGGEYTTLINYPLDPQLN